MLVGLCFWRESCPLHSVSLCLKSYIYKHFFIAKHDFVLLLQTLKLVQNKRKASSHSDFTLLWYWTWVIRINQITLTENLTRKCWNSQCLFSVAYILLIKRRTCVFDRSPTAPFVVWHAREWKIWRQKTYRKYRKRLLLKCLAWRGLAMPLWDVVTKFEEVR